MVFLHLYPAFSLTYIEHFILTSPLQISYTCTPSLSYLHKTLYTYLPIEILLYLYPVLLSHVHKILYTYYTPYYNYLIPVPRPPLLLT